MTSAQSWSRDWADVITGLSRRHPCRFSDGYISHYLRNFIIDLFCAAQRLLRTIFMQKSKPKYACLPSKIVEVWIERFCVHYDWWRRLHVISVPSVINTSGPWNGLYQQRGTPGCCVGCVMMAAQRTDHVGHRAPGIDCFIVIVSI